jgi:protein-tyrosine phosphatase
MSEKKKILMVCLGNICRSPVAEGIMLKLIEEKQLNLYVDSAGTSSNHVGEAPDPRTIRNAKKNGVDLSKLRARKFSVKDFDEFDHIYVMDESNYANVVSMAKSENHKSKVKLLLNELHPDKNLAVPDPWYGGEEGFEHVFHLVKDACHKLAEKFSNV